MNCALGGALCGFLASRFPAPFSSVVALLFPLIGWNLDVVTNWKQLKGSKLVIYHPLDGVIGHYEASLAETLKTNKHSEDTFTIQLSYLEEELNQPNPLYVSSPVALFPKLSCRYHCYPLSAVSAEWSALTDWARDALSPVS